jgi:3-hydroxybutyryl-CoA dehydratase
VAGPIVMGSDEMIAAGSQETVLSPVEPLRVGDRIARTLALNAAQLIAGAEFLQDANPLHNDAAVAARSRFGGLIASGPHIGGIHACMLPTHCNHLGLDVLGTYFTTRYVAPVMVDVEHELAWIVTMITPHKSGGWLVDWTGTISTFAANPVCCVQTTGQLLVSVRVSPN